MKIKLKTFIPAVLIPLAVGGLSALISNSAMKHFESIDKPIDVPPVLFPIIWTALYILMGISSYLVLESDCPWDKKRKALTVYGIQLALNFFWTIIFFNIGAYLFAFIELLALLVFVIIMIVQFYNCKKTSAYLQIPYLLWLLFAGFLNLGVYLLN